MDCLERVYKRTMETGRADLGTGEGMDLAVGRGRCHVWVYKGL